MDNYLIDNKLHNYIFKNTISNAVEYKGYIINPVSYINGISASYELLFEDIVIAKIYKTEIVFIVKNCTRESHRDCCLQFAIKQFGYNVIAKDVIPNYMNPYKSYSNKSEIITGNSIKSMYVNGKYKLIEYTGVAEVEDESGICISFTDQIIYSSAEIIVINTAFNSNISMLKDLIVNIISEKTKVLILNDEGVVILFDPQNIDYDEPIYPDYNINWRLWVGNYFM